MPRQGISFTPQNDVWLRAQVESEEYTSKSDVVNDLFRKVRDIETISVRLIQAENSLLTSQGRAEIVAKAKAEAPRNGDI